MLAYTGCRISEALDLTADRVDLKDGVIVLESLKKRRRGVYRAIPVPPVFLDTLNLVYDIRGLQKSRDRGKGVLLWTWSRTTAWRHVCNVMNGAQITGAHADAKRVEARVRYKGRDIRGPAQYPATVARSRSAFNDINLCRCDGAGAAPTR